MGIGFTGTRRGMTEFQKKAVSEFLAMLRLTFGHEFIHGAADGSDKQAEAMALVSGYVPQPIPAGDNPLARDHKIARQSEFVIATPFEYEEVMRSGTWATIRYARKYHTPGVIVWPDGAASPIMAKKHPARE